MNRPVKFLSDIFNVKPLTAEICLHTVFKPLKTVTYFREKESYLGEGISFLFFFFLGGRGDSLTYAAYVGLKLKILLPQP